MRHTWFPTDTAALPPPRLRGYMPLDDQPPLVDADITRFNPSFFWASGALVSNVDDLDRFYDALFDGRLLPRRLLAEMLTPVDTGAPGATYGARPGDLHPALRGGRGRPHRGPARLQLGLVPAARRRQGRPRGRQPPPGPDALYAALFSALVELFCDMTPAEASAAARANPDTARGIRFR
jgi:hypothetical protein